MESLLNEVLAQDLAFKEVFDPERGTNSFIREFQEKAKKELLKLLEIVLLDKHSYINPSDRDVLEKRLGSLLAPKGLDPKAQSLNQLRLIDAYLADENAKVTIQEALDLIKPFFHSQMQKMMIEHADSLCHELCVP